MPSPYGVLVTAFGVGVWTSAGRRGAGHITAALLVGYAVIGAVKGIFFSAPTREVLEAGKETWRNIMHLPGTAVTVLSILLAIGFGSTLLGRRFWYYSYATILAILAFGVLAGLQVDRVAADQPTHDLLDYVLHRYDPLEGAPLVYDHRELEPLLLQLLLRVRLLGI